MFLCIVSLVAFAIVPFSFHTVDTGTVAVVKYLGNAKYLREAGTYFDLWVTKSYQRYSSKVQSAEIDTETYSSDAQTMNIKMTLQYKIQSDKVVDIAKQYGSLSSLQSRVVSISTEKAKAEKVSFN